MYALGLLRTGTWYVLVPLLPTLLLVYHVASRWARNKHAASRALPANWQKRVDCVFARHVPAVRRELIRTAASPRVYTNATGSHSLTRKQAESYASEPPRKVPGTIYGFFHPNADAGGGGERVLWAAVRQTLQSSPTNICVVYVRRSQRSLNSSGMLATVKLRFGLSLDAQRVVFIYVRRAQMVQASHYPAFTLLGQAIGSMVLANEALSKLMPDVFVDTMGLPFCYPLVALVAQVPIVAYVHYPVISKDMLAPLGFSSPRAVFKQLYWRLFMMWYAFCGSYASKIAVNSTWTWTHIKDLWHWGHQPSDIQIVYPPCATQDFAQLHTEREKDKRVPRSAVYLAQFRPEKRHSLVLEAFAHVPAPRKLWLVGSLRTNEDRRLVSELQGLCEPLGLVDDVEFVLDAAWEQVREILGQAQVGIDAMWNEHFGMVVVEYMAAGLVAVVHDSAGPKLDIVRDGEGFRFVSSCDPDFRHDHSSLTLQDALHKAFTLSCDDRAALVDRAKLSAERFSDQVFADRWDSLIREPGAKN